ncbi:ankyrin repeat domain-containing protein, partial [Methylicorpusculum sp.]|uniref:ankyrin repeat domain-containing protein n=1 Tax=Methylicorpusculum sp. TaxID=2713644 RepID=UPI002AB7FB7F
FEGQTDSLAFLIENGANIEAKDNDKQTPLYWALSNGHHETAQFLIELGAEIDPERCLNATINSCSKECGELLLDTLEQKEGKSFVQELLNKKNKFEQTAFEETANLIEECKLFGKTEYANKATELQSLFMQRGAQ